MRIIYIQFLISDQKIKNKTKQKRINSKGLIFSIIMKLSEYK